MARFLFITFGIFLAFGFGAAAAPVRYVLEEDASRVAFETDFGQGEIRGRMPVSSADIRLDFQNIAASTIRVRLNVAAARTNIPFATEAMTGPRVLDARNHPEIAFESTRIRASGGRAQVEGRLTIRGVTRPVTLAAEILSYGAGGEQDLSDLEIRLGTAVNRSDYGATGFADMVGDEVRILIVARILRAP